MPCFSQAQHVQSNTSLLKKAFQKIGSYKFDRYGDGSNDSLNAFNDDFERLLLRITSVDPNSISQPFNELKKLGLHIATADDGNFRIYSWDDQTGGTMRYFRSVFQFKSKGQIQSTTINTDKSIDEDGKFYKEIFQVNAKDKTYYLVYGIFTGSTAIHLHNLKAFSISDGALGRVRIIKTKTGLKNQLGYEVDYSDSDNRPSVIDINETLVQYDPKTQSISFPLIQESGKITEKKSDTVLMGNTLKRFNYPLIC